MSISNLDPWLMSDDDHPFLDMPHTRLRRLLAASTTTAIAAEYGITEALVEAMRDQMLVLPPKVKKTARGRKAVAAGSS